MDNDEVNKSGTSESGGIPNQGNHNHPTGSSVASITYISETSVASRNTTSGLEADQHCADDERDGFGSNSNFGSGRRKHVYDHGFADVKDFCDAGEKENAEAQRYATENCETKEQMRGCLSNWLPTRTDEEYFSAADNFIPREVQGISDFCKDQLLERLIKFDEFVAVGRSRSHDTSDSEIAIDAGEGSSEGCGKSAVFKKISLSSQSEYEIRYTTSEEDANSIMCRICYHGSWGTPDLGPLVSPCNCRGSVQMVHMACLQRWLSESGTDTCDLCGFRFRVRWIQRTGLLSCFFAWLCTEEDAIQLLMDLGLLFVMTPLVMFTAHRCLEASNDMFRESRSGQLVLISLLLLVGYIAQVSYYFWIISAFFYHANNWLRWWKANFTIEILPPEDAS